MKEADDGSGRRAAAGPGPNEPTNGKIDKDMKGLVYQGGVPEDSEPQQGDQYPTDSTTSEPKEDKEGKEGEGEKAGEYKGVSAPEGSKEDSILTFTEKDNKGKVIALIVIVAIIIVGVAYLLLHSSLAKGHTTTITKTTISGNTPTTTIAAVVNHNKTVISGIDLLYNYSGPKKINNTNCQFNTRSIVIGYSAHLNASTVFFASSSQLTYHTSAYCPLVIKNIVATTPGFRIVSVEPSLPVHIPAYSQVTLTIRISTPPFNYTGPLSITINENTQ